MTNTGPYLTINTVVSSSVTAQATVTSCFDKFNFPYSKFCCDLGSLGKDKWLIGNLIKFLEKSCSADV